MRCRRSYYCEVQVSWEYTRQTDTPKITVSFVLTITRSFLATTYYFFFFSSQPRKVYATDLNSTTLDNLRYNASINNLCTNRGDSTNDENIFDTATPDDNTSGKFDKVIVQRMDWSDEATWPQESDNTIDFILGSDLIYDKAVMHRLKHVVLRLLQRGGGTFYYTCKSTERDGMAEFVADLQQDGVTLVHLEEISAPHPFTSNPLQNGDDDECFLHFHELTTTSYMLYEFTYC